MTDFILTKDNYFSTEASRIYCGSSQLKQFVNCEAQAIAQLKGEYIQEPNEAMLQGSYVHAWCEGTLDKFIEEHPEIMLKKGGLREPFKTCEMIIDTITNDKALSGIIAQCEKEQIFTGEIMGVPFKIMVDMLNIEKGYFVDLKVMKSISEQTWSDEYKRKVNFIIAWKYDWQMAIYMEILRQNFGKLLIPNIIALSKEKVPDKALITFATENEGSLEAFMDAAFNEMKEHILRVKDLKKGGKSTNPYRCGKCDYCRSTKQITEPVYWLDM